jgi:hypothetical protein
MGSNKPSIAAVKHVWLGLRRSLSYKSGESKEKCEPGSYDPVLEGIHVESPLRLVGFPSVG